MPHHSFPSLFVYVSNSYDIEDKQSIHPIAYTSHLSRLTPHTACNSFIAAVSRLTSSSVASPDVIHLTRFSPSSRKT